MSHVPSQYYVCAIHVTPFNSNDYDAYCRKDYDQNTDQLRIISLDYRQAIAGDMDLVSFESSSSPLLTLEWMENVAKMAQLELMRKKAIVYYIVTSVDAQHVLSIINDAHWSSNSSYSNIDMSYGKTKIDRYDATCFDRGRL